MDTRLGSSDSPGPGLLPRRLSFVTIKHNAQPPGLCDRAKLYSGTAEKESSRKLISGAALGNLGKPIYVYSTQLAFAVEAWRKSTGPQVQRWLDAVGELEALCSLAGYAYEHPANPVPELSEEGPIFECRGIGHPLLPAARCVRNDVSLDSGCRVLIVSGSNMSGKSTLLRAVGVNVAASL